MKSNKNQTTHDSTVSARLRIPHPPGPYSYRRSVDGCDNCFDILAAGDDRPLVAIHFRDDEDGSCATRAEAIARLFAAAPDLLEALRLADMFMAAKAGDQYTASDTLRLVRAAVAKVEGDIKEDVNAAGAQDVSAHEGQNGREAASANLDRFGGCPICLGNSGYLSVRETQWFYCRHHRTKWLGGENLFSSRRDEGQADWDRNAVQLVSYVEVEPEFPQPPYALNRVTKELVAIEKRRAMIPDEVYFNLLRVMEYRWEDEMDHFRHSDERGRRNHIFRRLVTIQNWLLGVQMKPEALIVNWMIPDFD